MKNRYKKNDNLIFIPVRGGSTRLKNKNLQKINGISLLKKKILTCKKANIGSIVVSSENNKILNEASNIKGVKIFKRKFKYSTSYASSISTVLEYLRNIRKKNLLPKYVTLVPVTNPFLHYKTIVKAYKKIIKSQKFESIISITECSEPPYLHVKIGKKLKFNIYKEMSGKRFERSQDYPKAYIETASIRISRISYFLKYISNKDPKFSKPLFNQNSCGYIKIKKLESYDINTKKDLLYARILEGL